MQTIVELPEYLHQAASVLGEDEKSGIINTLARNPTAGAVVTGTGGIRKLRWSRAGTGKSAGVLQNWLRYFVRITQVSSNEQSI